MTIDVVVMRVVTRFPTAAEFVAGFGRYCTDTTCFIPTTERKTPGIETGFSIRLADGAPVLRGLCVVLDSWSAVDSPFQRAGVNLGIRSITPESREVFERLQAVRANGATTQPIEIAPLLGNEAPSRELTAETPHRPSTPPPLPARASAPLIDTKPTVEMTPLFAEPGGILPANPLTEMSDSALGDFIDCMLYEDAVPLAPFGEHEHGDTAPVVMVQVAISAPMQAPPGRDSIATMLGVQPLRLTPVYAPLPTPVASAPVVERAVRMRDTQQTMKIAAHRAWWRGVSRWIARVAELVRHPHGGARHARRAVAERSRRGPRRPRTGLAPIPPGPPGPAGA